MATDKQKNKVAEELNKLLTKEKDILDAINESQKLQDKAMRSVLSSQSELINLHKLEKRLLNEIAKAKEEGRTADAADLDIRKNILKEQQNFEKVIKKTKGALTGVSNQAKKLTDNIKK